MIDFNIYPNIMIAMLDTLIVNGSLAIPNIGIIKKNIGIKDSRISIITNDRPVADKVINAEKRYIIPGVIDPHVHYGVFEPIERAAEHESRSAATGGVTCMMRMFRLYGSYKENLMKHLSVNTHIIDYAYHASILLKEQIDEMDYCRSKGIRSFKLYMNLQKGLGKIYMDMDPYNDQIIEREVDTDKEMIINTIRNSKDDVIIVHAEDPEICKNGINKLKSVRNDLKAWSDARPSKSERIAIEFLKSIDDYTLYLPHIGSREGLEAALDAKRSSRVYIETCPHYLTHTYDFDLRGKVVPPLRSKDDQVVLWNALKNDQIDCIGSDHVANRLKDKLADNTVWNALAGFPGVATILPVMLSEGVNKNRITLEQLVKITSYNQARIFNLKNKGNIAIGYDADLTIIDLDKEVRVTPDILNSYSDYTIYDNMILRGWPVLTMVRGEVVMEDGMIIGKAGYGKYIAR
ncbi:MAG: dihydroorotase-like protein [Candidatus Nitrosocaldaceae archaeon]|nr:MAG: dihydroorotase-like protein [Candidatus Nitrosocaldaceae archaeon]GIU72726.1 MAG: dihydroorotase-like protein [Candidatus Nitrosocaldaceae archaeon]